MPSPLTVPPSDRPSPAAQGRAGPSQREAATALIWSPKSSTRASDQPALESKILASSVSSHTVAPRGHSAKRSACSWPALW
eukprot:10866983-Alexandrium_andersonii.AAC.1